MNDREVSLNIFKVNLYPGNVRPLSGESNKDALLANLQKGFHSFETLVLEVGSQHEISANNGTQKVDYQGNSCVWGVRWQHEFLGREK